MNDASGVLWRRLRYMLTPQFDLYQAIASKVEGRSVLDVGCGTGFGTLQLTRTAREVCGIDFDPEAVRFAKDCIPGVNWRCADILDAGWGNGHLWDVILMVEVLEHIPRWRNALARAEAMLYPNGLFIMTARNANADLRRVELHEREWTAEELVSNLGEFFPDVRLYDHTLETEQATDTRITPLIAVASKSAYEVTYAILRNMVGILNPTHPERYDVAA